MALSARIAIFRIVGQSGLISDHDTARPAQRSGTTEHFTCRNYFFLNACRVLTTLSYQDLAKLYGAAGAVISCSVSMTSAQKQRIEQIGTCVRFYRESLAAMATATQDTRLITLIDTTLQAVNQIEADPLLHAQHGRRRPDLLLRWLVSVEERLRSIDADYKILVHWLEHHARPAQVIRAPVRIRSAEQGFVRSLTAEQVQFVGSVIRRISVDS